jgi:drug/metabolite transporter (DMT)-like permease
MNLWMLVIGGALLWTIGDIFIKYWLTNQKPSFFIIGIAIWTIGLLFLAYSFRFKNMAVASTMMVILNSIFLIFVSWLFFKEQISLIQLLGIILGLIGLYLLEIG